MRSKRPRTEEQPAAPATPATGSASDREQGVVVQRSGTADRLHLLALHKARFVEWTPTAAVASAASDDGSVLAVARESGDVELWQTDYWHCLARLSGSKDASTTSIAWLQEPGTGQSRLFTAGLDGILVEWDLLKRRPKHRTESMGGAVWALAVQPAPGIAPGALPKMAVACDDGCLRLFTAEVGMPGLQYESCLPPLDGRLLCAAWHPEGSVLVTGTSKRTLHAWEVASRHELLRLHTGDEGKTHQDVWVVKVLADGTMVTGDGGGNLQFWDAVHGSLVAGFSQHRADILALAASKDGRTVFASGVDSQLALFQRIPDTLEGQVRWEYLQSKRTHTHDVRVLVAFSPSGRDELLISGGNDAQLFAHLMHRFTKTNPVRICKAPEPPLLTVSKATAEGDAPLLLSAERCNLDLWRLGSEAIALEGEEPATEIGEGQRMDLAAMPKHEARLSAAHRGHISAIAVSPQGDRLALVDAEGLSVYSIQRISNTAGASSIKLERNQLKELAALKPLEIAFAGDQWERLLVADSDGVLTVLDLNKEGQVLVTFRNAMIVPRRIPKLESTSRQLFNSIMTVGVSPDGRWAALSRPNDVHLFDLNSLSHHGSLPHRENNDPNSATAFGPASDIIAIATTGNSLTLYDINTRRATELPELLAKSLPKRLQKVPGLFSGLSFHPDPVRRATWVSTPSSLCFVDFEETSPASPPPVKSRRRIKDGRSYVSAGAQRVAKVLQLENVCLLFAFTDKRSAVLVEKEWARVLERFPPPLYRHRYGS